MTYAAAARLLSAEAGMTGIEIALSTVFRNIEQRLAGLEREYATVVGSVQQQLRTKNVRDAMSSRYAVAGIEVQEIGEKAQVWSLHPSIAEARDTILRRPKDERSGLLIWDRWTQQEVAR
jgi:hypothetical protein